MRSQKSGGTTGNVACWSAFYNWCCAHKTLRLTTANGRAGRGPCMECVRTAGGCVILIRQFPRCHGDHVLLFPRCLSGRLLVGSFREFLLSGLMRLALGLCHHRSRVIICRDPQIATHPQPVGSARSATPRKHNSFPFHHRIFSPKIDFS